MPGQTTAVTLALAQSRSDSPPVLGVGGKATMLLTTAKDANGVPTDVPVNLSSSDTTVAKVTSAQQLMNAPAGVVGVGPGTATITATASDNSGATATLTVKVVTP